jgi:hypothetical protein
MNNGGVLATIPLCVMFRGLPARNSLATAEFTR